MRYVRSMINDLNLSLLEICAVLGVVQTVAVLVYIVSRAGHLRHIIIPFLTFFVFAACFLFDFASRRYAEVPSFAVWQSACWLVVPAVSSLFVRQIICLGGLPPRPAWLVLIIPVVIWFGSYAICSAFDVGDWVFQIGFMLCAGLSLSSLWLGHESFSLHDDEKEARGERYWLIISLILINLSLMATYLMVLYEGTPDNIFHLVRDVLGVGLVYLGSTSLFRIYPPAVRLSKNNYAPTELSNEDKNIIECIHKLLELDKVYQELQFSRAHLARELNISEARVSKLVNVHFGKSLPQLINDYRVRDSLQLLEQTGASVTVVAQEVGFNSLPTFNRVFKDVMGVSPSDYRQRKKSA
mgnify:CR=1 FL=1